MHVRIVACSTVSEDGRFGVMLGASLDGIPLNFHANLKQPLAIMVGRVCAICYTDEFNTENLVILRSS